MLRLDKATYLSLLFKFIFPERLINSLWGSDVLLFSKFINVVSILFYNIIEFIVLLCFLVTLLVRYKEYIICLIWFSKFSNIFPAFTCTIGNPWGICLGVNILRPLPYFALYLASDSKKNNLSNENFFDHFILHLFDLLILKFYFLFLFCLDLI